MVVRAIFMSWVRQSLLGTKQFANVINYMYHYEKLFRFLTEDGETLKEVIQNAKSNLDVDFTSQVAKCEEGNSCCE